MLSAKIEVWVKRLVPIALVALPLCMLDAHFTAQEAEAARAMTPAARVAGAGDDKVAACRRYYGWAI